VGAAEDVLALTEGMPERRLAAGEVLYRQGDDSPAEVGVLVAGSLRLELDGSPLDEVTVPGTFVGEVGALLGSSRPASVVATTAATVRMIGDPEAFFGTHPQLSVQLARQLAGRLDRLLAYLHDLRGQYAGSDGHLTVVASVLGRLASRPAVEIEPGSDRSPDY
jgi:CRP/FNR family transcriptional regulator, cyclic AMP receptor protein